MKLHIIKIASVAVLAGLGLTGCLKDKAFDDGEIQSNYGSYPSVIELRVTASSSVNFITEAFANSTTDTTVGLVPVHLATGATASEDINVTVAVDPSLVTAYNTANGASYDIATSSMYSIASPNGVVTIPKGSNTGYLQVKFKSHDYQSFTQSWAIGFRITNIDKPGYTISGNIGTAVVAIAVKNDYDGIYSVTGYFAHPSAPRSINIAAEVLTTVNPSTINKPVGDLGLGTGGSTSINVTVNSDNSVTITPVTNNTSGVGAISGDATYNNRYDPATKTFWLKYGYPMPSPTRIITEKLTFVSPRP